MAEATEKQLLTLLDELSKSIEELLLAGLTAASQATVARLDVVFKEASRMKLLRLGSTLRIASEEIARFDAGSPQFSARRLTFFLGRAWLLSSAMQRALGAGNQAALAGLQGAAPATPISRLRAVVLGVVKRVVMGAFASFDFRLRTVEGDGAAPGQALVWSCVFPLRKEQDLPAEAYLHLPQKQKFKPAAWLEKKVLEVSDCAAAAQAGGAARLVLGERSTVAAKEDFSDWASVWSWDMGRAAERLTAHRPSPMDLDVELQEEVFFDSWKAGKAEENEAGYDALPLEARYLPFEVRLDRGPSGTPLRGVLTKLAEKKRPPPLFGLAHYESCRMILQPLSVLGKDGIEYLTISPEKISQAELVKAMKFT